MAKSELSAFIQKGQELSGDMRMGQGDEIFKGIKGGLFVCRPIQLHFLLGEVEERVHMMREISDEMMVEVDKAQE